MRSVRGKIPRPRQGCFTVRRVNLAACLPRTSRRRSERAALIDQHEAGGADAAITHAIDAHVDAERFRDNDDDDGQAGCSCGGLMARDPTKVGNAARLRLETPSLTWAFT
jgi:hypothetical protein